MERSSALVSPVDLLNAHAEALFGPEEGELPTLSSGDSELVLLMALAERIKAVLAPVKPSPAFVEALGHELAQTSMPAVEILPSRRPPWIIGAAAVGSALSLLGLYHFLRESRRLLRRAS